MDESENKRVWLLIAWSSDPRPGDPEVYVYDYDQLDEARTRHTSWQHELGHEFIVKLTSAPVLRGFHKEQS
jgi:hypothetical protein